MPDATSRPGATSKPGSTSLPEATSTLDATPRPGATSRPAATSRPGATSGLMMRRGLVLLQGLMPLRGSVLLQAGGGASSARLTAMQSATNDSWKAIPIMLSCGTTSASPAVASYAADLQHGSATTGPRKLIPSMLRRGMAAASSAVASSAARPTSICTWRRGYTVAQRMSVHAGHISGGRSVECPSGDQLCQPQICSRDNVHRDGRQPAA